MITTGIVLIEEHAQRVKPPRMLAVPFNFGYTLGEPENPEYQHKVLRAAFDLLGKDRGPVLERFQGRILPELVMHRSKATDSHDSQGMDAADEITTLMNSYDHWMNSHQGRTAVGLSDIPPQRFYEITQFFEGYISGKQSDLPGRPKEISIPQFIRYCGEDLKAFCFEAKMAKHPDLPANKVHDWFWSESATGILVSKLSDRMKDDGDRDVRSAAYGIAR